MVCKRTKFPSFFNFEFILEEMKEIIVSVRVRSATGLDLTII